MTPDSALKISVVYRCVRVLSETISTLPLILYRRLENGGKERAIDHPAYRILHDAPNSYQTSVIFRDLLQTQVTLRGNGYAQIVRNQGQKLVELIPLPSEKISPKMVYNDRLGRVEIFYEYRTPSNQTVVLTADQILHLKGPTHDGFIGSSVIDYARDSIGLTMAEEKHAASYFQNAASPNGILEYPGKMSPEAVKNLRESFDRTFSGIGNAYRTIALEGGVKFTPITMTNEQSQFIQSRKFQITDICRWFGVPPHLAMDLERATFSNIEHQSLEFLTHTMRPWFVRWEQTLNAALLTESERQEYFFEFLVDGLLRGDINSRYSAYAIGRQNGWLSADEIRSLENMNPLPNGAGQQYLRPLNMTDATPNDQNQSNSDTSTT